MFVVWIYDKFIKLADSKNSMLTFKVYMGEDCGAETVQLTLLPYHFFVYLLR